MSNPKAHATREDGAKAYLVTWMEGGRPAIVFGWSTTDPEEGKSCRLLDARMVLCYTQNGTFGLASEGPQEGSLISTMAHWALTGPVLSALPVTAQAADSMTAWPPCGA